MTGPRWHHLDHREFRGRDVVLHWLAEVERYCVDSGRAVHHEGDRCRPHGGRGEMCYTAERLPGKCTHALLSPNHPYPHCSECGRTPEDVTDEVGRESGDA